MHGPTATAITAGMGPRIIPDRATIGTRVALNPDTVSTTTAVPMGCQATADMYRHTTVTGRVLGRIATSRTFRRLNCRCLTTTGSVHAGAADANRWSQARRSFPGVSESDAGHVVALARGSGVKNGLSRGLD